MTSENGMISGKGMHNPVRAKAEFMHKERLVCILLTKFCGSGHRHILPFGAQKQKKTECVVY